MGHSGPARAASRKAARRSLGRCAMSWLISSSASMFAALTFVAVEFCDPREVISHALQCLVSSEFCLNTLFNAQR